MKKEKNKGIAKRLVVICSLAIALIVALGAFSFAWLQNYGTVGTATITTGKMLYKITMYRVENGEIQGEPKVLLDTTKLDESLSQTEEAGIEGNNVLTADISDTVIKIDNKRKESIFFVIEKDADSIDFDVSISFENDGLSKSANYDNIGQMKYWLYDDSASLAENYGNDVASYVKNSSADAAKANPSLNTLWTKIEKTTLSDKSVASLRFELDTNAAQDVPFEDDEIPFRIKFCIAQKDKLPEQADKAQTHYVKTPAELYNVMQSYGFNDEIIITGDSGIAEINYSEYGDLVFTRPCKLTLIRANLIVKGNVSFSYMYDGNFTIDTISDGHIYIEKNSLGAAGNLRIDLPNAKIDIKGANSDALDKADIYVAGSFTANASTEADRGISLQGARICDPSIVEDENKNNIHPLEPLLLNGNTRLSISIRTRVGKITALSKLESGGVDCKRVIIENRGIIEKIDLSSMIEDKTYRAIPVIDIDNMGTIGELTRAEEVDPKPEDADVILLPSWSRKFDEENGAESGLDNTRIRANKGSNKIMAIASGKSFTLSAEYVNGETFFFSRGDKGASGYRDDIEQELRRVFVEAVGGDSKKIIIHYEAPSKIAIDENSRLGELNTLQSYVEYYAEKGDIAPVNQITEATIVCYGGKALTAPPLISGSGLNAKYDTSLAYDYNFIKSMTALTKLDLSDAVSADKKVPNHAFKGMSNLSSVKMSESDTVWGQYIFTGTGVDEITFPQALTKLDNPINNSTGKVNKQYVLDGIKYVYTSITIVDGFYLTQNTTQYLFTPDQYTYDAYRALYSDIYWNSKIFINNGATRYGDFFLRYDSTTTELVPTCEFVAYTGGIKTNAQGLKENISWLEKEYNNCGFDFQRININGRVYTITSFDPYALFDQLVAEEGLEIVIGSDVKFIGERAFACGPNMNAKIGLESVIIEGDPVINGSAFAYNDTLISVSAPELTTLYGGQNFSNCNLLKTFYAPKLGEVKGDKDISNCPELERIDISVIERNDTNKSFYTSNDSYSYAKFYIHTENAQDVSSYKSALAADYRHIFVEEDYAELYRKTSTYTGVAAISGYKEVKVEGLSESQLRKNSIDDLIVADSNGNDPVDGARNAYYYVLDYTDPTKVKANLVACLLPEINELGNDYTTIASFKHNNIDYPVTYIGSAAYHFTSIIAQKIKISDGVENLGAYSFDSSKENFKKYCITLDLNDSVIAGKGAFYYMDMARVVGDKLEEVGENTFSYNQNLIVANLPNLSRSRSAGTTATAPTVFLKCTRLRIIYTSISNDIVYDGAESRIASYVRFINITNIDKTITIPNINTVVNSFEVQPYSGFYRNCVNVSNDFAKIHLSDFYDYEVNLLGMSEDISLPGYVFYENNDGNLTLFAVSPDVSLYSLNGKTYTTPSELYLNNEKKYTAKYNGTAPIYKVTKIGKYAYGAASFSGIDKFVVGSNVIEIEDYGLYGTAYLNSSTSETMLKHVEHLDLSNVEIIGKGACKKAMVTKLTANKLKILGEDCFGDCSNLQSVYLPNFESANGKNTFNACVSLESATFGENTKIFFNAMFQGAKKLQKITILNSNAVVALNASTAKLINSYEVPLNVYVPTSIYKAYAEQYAGGFGGISVGNIKKFGSTSKIDGLTYYWDGITKPIFEDEILVNSNDCTAYIDYIEGTLPTNLTLPSTFTAEVDVLDNDGNTTGKTVSVTYKVISVSASAMKALSGVTSVTLPANMQYLTFTTADIAESVEALVIDGDNGYFKTDGGVLYTKDGSTLLVYPRGRTAASFTVGSGVTEIAYRAFYGANIETLNIAGNVTIRDQAFEAANNMNSIVLTSGKNVTFAGRDTFLGANVNLKINANGATVRILTDYSIAEKLH